jgi:hypothetical protein
MSCMPVIPIRVPPCMDDELQACTHACNFLDRLCTGGPTPTKTPVRPSVQTLPKNRNPNSMQDDTTTNLKLVGPESAASISRNLQNSSKLARPLNNTTGTNEVALWALQLYIVHFSKLPDSIQGAPGIHFSICLHPRDQHPVIYTMTVPGPLFILSPRGPFFSYSAQVRMLTLLNTRYMIFLFRYCSRRVFVFHVCRYLIIISQQSSFRYILNTGM